jgi:hypothetical protein
VRSPGKVSRFIAIVAVHHRCFHFLNFERGRSHGCKRPG